MASIFDLMKPNSANLLKKYLVRRYSLSSEELGRRTNKEQIKLTEDALAEIMASLPTTEIKAVNGSTPLPTDSSHKEFLDKLRIHNILEGSLILFLTEESIEHFIKKKRMKELQEMLKRYLEAISSEKYQWDLVEFEDRQLSNIEKDMLLQIQRELDYFNFQMNSFNEIIINATNQIQFHRNNKKLIRKEIFALTEDLANDIIDKTSSFDKNKPADVLTLRKIMKHYILQLYKVEKAELSLPELRIQRDELRSTILKLSNAAIKNNLPAGFPASTQFRLGQERDRSSNGELENLRQELKKLDDKIIKYETIQSKTDEQLMESAISSAVKANKNQDPEVLTKLQEVSQNAKTVAAELVPLANSKVYENGGKVNAGEKRTLVSAFKGCIERLIAENAQKSKLKKQLANTENQKDQFVVEHSSRYIDFKNILKRIEKNKAQSFKKDLGIEVDLNNDEFEKALSIKKTSMQKSSI